MYCTFIRLLLFIRTVWISIDYFYFYIDMLLYYIMSTISIYSQSAFLYFILSSLLLSKTYNSMCIIRIIQTDVTLFIFGLHF